MKILCIELEALNLPWMMSCVEAGHEVFWYAHEEQDPSTKKNVGDGIPGITKVDNWVPYVKKVDLTVHMDNAKFLERLDAFKKQGYKIYAPSVKSAELEIKREAGLKFLEAHGIKCPVYKKFKTLEEAQNFLMSDKGRYVMKTLGDEEDKSLSYCAKDAADMIEHMNWLKMNGIIPKDSFILQEYIKGIEFAVNSWMGSKGYIGLPGFAFEHKGLMPSEKGPSTGEQGTVHKYGQRELFFDKILKPLEKDLTALGHLGNIDVNCIIDEEGNIWPLEFTARNPYPGWQLMLNQHKGDPAQWMLDACNGMDTLKQVEETGICVVITIPPFPFKGDKKEEKKDKGLPIYGITNGNKKHIKPQFVKMGTYIVQDEKGNLKKQRGLVTAGNYVLVVDALGNSIEQCRERVYKTVDELHIPGIMYRDDIGEKVQKWLPNLHKLGFAKDFK
jgi:phosphoribosylamine---glycine ligase